MILRHKFVDIIPEIIEEGVLYISIPYCTAIHKCVCGCGNEVVTPLSPVGWSITYDGESVSLYPSIGNWSFMCKSHYWISNSKIRFAGRWSDEEIILVRDVDKIDLKSFYMKKRKRKSKK